jgi:hypothetical protein
MDTYQWRKNGSPISGATNRIYTKSSIIPSDGGQYSVVVTRDGVSREFTSSQVTVAPDEPPFPLIVNFPAGFDGWTLLGNVLRLDVASYAFSLEADDLMPTTTETFYVSMSGSDSNNGTSSGTAKETIAGVLADATGTPRIRIAPGTYAIPTTISRSCILEGDGGQWAPNAEYTVTSSGFVIGWKGLRVDHKITTIGTSTHIFDEHECNVESGTANLRIQSNTSAYIFDGSAVDLSASDAYSWDGNAKVVLVRCSGNNIGSGPNDNFATGHGTTRALIIDCDFANAYRNIHTVASGGNSKFMVFAGSSKQSKGSQSLGNSFNIGAGFSETSGSAVTGWVYGCDCDDTGLPNSALHSLFAASGSTLYYDNETTFKSTGGAGTIALFERDIAPQPKATGGTISTSGGFTRHLLANGDTFELLEETEVEIELIAAGGEGATVNSTTTRGGPGGAGEYVRETLTLPAGVYPVVIGAPATLTTATTLTSGGNGGNATFAGLTALGGGGGGTVGVNGANGGSGGAGGVASTAVSPGSSIASDGVGFGGGASIHDAAVGTNRATGGGGGAGGVGQDATAGTRGLGGAGVASQVPGLSETVCIGGNGTDSTISAATPEAVVGAGSGGHGQRQAAVCRGNAGRLYVWYES